jgi:hypothetical protein
MYSVLSFTYIINAMLIYGANHIQLTERPNMHAVTNYITSKCVVIYNLNATSTLLSTSAHQKSAIAQFQLYLSAYCI